MDGILQVLYTCHGCDIVERKVTVRHRHEGEEIAPYMKYLQERVGTDHMLKSPQCHEGKCDLKIPIDKGLGIGYARKAEEKR